MKYQRKKMDNRFFLIDSIIFTKVLVHPHMMDVSPQKIVRWRHDRRSRKPGDVAILWILSFNPSSWEIFIQPVARAHL